MVHHEASRRDRPRTSQDRPGEVQHARPRVDDYETLGDEGVDGRQSKAEYGKRKNTVMASATPVEVRPHSWRQSMFPLRGWVSVYGTRVTMMQSSRCSLVRSGSPMSGLPRVQWPGARRALATLNRDARGHLVPARRSAAYRVVLGAIPQGAQPFRKLPQLWRGKQPRGLNQPPRVSSTRAWLQHLDQV